MCVVWAGRARCAYHGEVGVAWAMQLKMTRRRFWVAVAGLVEAPACHPALEEDCPPSASSPVLVLAAGFGEQG